MVLVKVEVLQWSMVTAQLIPIHQHGPIGIQLLIILTLETTMNTTVLFLKRFML